MYWMKKLFTTRDEVMDFFHKLIMQSVEKHNRIVEHSEEEYKKEVRQLLDERDVYLDDLED